MFQCNLVLLLFLTYHQQFAIYVEYSNEKKKVKSFCSLEFYFLFIKICVKIKINIL